MKLKLKTIDMSVKTELSSKGKYRVSLVEPPMAVTAMKSYLQISFVYGYLRGVVCRPLVSRLTASIFETGDKRTPNDKLVVRNNKLEYFTQKERN